MSKLTGATLDRAVANALGLKSVHNCEKWGEHMMSRIEEDDDTQVYKKPWVGLTSEELLKCADGFHGKLPCGWADIYYAIEAKLKEKNT